jgi:hypothetical protein
LSILFVILRIDVVGAERTTSAGTETRGESPSIFQLIDQLENIAEKLLARQVIHDIPVV